MKKKKNGNGHNDWMRQLGLGVKKTDAGKGVTIDPTVLAQEALKAVKGKGAKDGMVTIEETRRFAGKNIVIQRDVGKDSKDAAMAQKKKDRLDALLESIAPAKKVSVLDKSKSDWSTFKSKDDEILEELESHKKSAGTYLGKKEFLSRADLAEYERERDRKLSSDVRNRGRL